MGPEQDIWPNPWLSWSRIFGLTLGFDGTRNLS